MDARIECPVCGTRITSNCVGGQCPRCLLRLALEPAGDEGGEVAAQLPEQTVSASGADAREEPKGAA